MITGRAPLYNNSGTIGYFDYLACTYPAGQVDQTSYFFNSDDIAEVLFEGYADEDEEEFRKIYNEMIEKTTYPKLHLEFSE